jgi:uncharacterized protein
MNVQYNLNRNRRRYLTSYVSLFLLAVTLWYTWLFPLIGKLKGNQILYESLWLGGRMLIWVVPVLLILEYADLHAPCSYLKLKFNQIKGLTWGLVIGFIYIAFLLLKDYFLGDKSLNFNIGIHYWLGGLLIGLIEEIPFRGFLLQKIEENMGFWKANLISSILFTVHHYPKWIYQGTGGMILNSVTVLIVGLIFGYVFKKTKSLWSVVILHSIYDLANWIIIGGVGA